MERGPKDRQSQGEINSKQLYRNEFDRKVTEEDDKNSVRLLVQEEGRAARNLIAFSVPCDVGQVDNSKVSRKPPSSPRNVQALQEVKKEDSGLRNSKRTSDTLTAGSRVRSASTGRDKKSELQARYWAFLFGNLQRAVDEIYQTCETDESVSECKEVILVLENFTRDFHSLIEWFRLKWEYEKTPPPQRPTSLAWEVRKSSPGKIHHPVVTPLLSSAKRNLSFNESCGKNIANPIPQKALDALQDDKYVPVVPPFSQDRPIDSSEQNEKSSEPIMPTGETSSDDTKLILDLNAAAEEKLPEAPDEKPGEDTAPSMPLVNDAEGQVVPMVDQASQTDPELDDVPPEPLATNPAADRPAHVAPAAKTTTSTSTSLVTKVPPIPSGFAARGVRGAPAAAAGVGPLPRPSTARAGVAAGPAAPAKPSTASIVKRGTARQAANCAAQPLNRVAAPTLVRSRTIAEVGRPNRPQQNHRNGSRQPCGAEAAQAVQLVQTRASRSFESGMDPRRNASAAHEGQKKIETCDDGWETVKNRSRWRLSYNPKQRFNQPTCAVSLPALSIVDNNENVPTSLMQHENGQVSQTTKVRELPKNQSRPVTEKVVNGTSKSIAGKQMGKDVKEENNKMILKNKTQTKDSRATQHLNGISKAKSRQMLPVNDKEKGKVKVKRVDTKNKERNVAVEEKKIEKEHRNIDTQNKEEMATIFKSLYNCGNKPANLDLDSQLSGDESSVGPRTSSTNTPTTITPTTTPATPTTPTNSSDTLVFLRESDCGIERLISDDEELIAERTLLKEEERKSQQLYEEEAKLQQQIHDLETGDLEVEVETDGETQIGTEEDEEEEELLDGEETRDAEVDTMSLEDRYENMLEGLSWAERMDTLEQLEALVARHPGRALQLHQKLSSPSRCRATTLPETLRRFQARQEKAQQKRERLLQLKSQRLRELLNKVGEVKAAQAQLTEDRRMRLENKLKRAEENRNLHLRSIKRKAHDEEEKLKEIAFINELEAQNKRHDFLALRQEQEERLQGIAEERQRKQEEKAAKEAAVEERRRALEAERLHKLEEMQARRKRRVERIHREQQEKEKERLEAAREKARDREERLSALHAAQLATQEELQKKIQQKQEDSARRHEENIEHIRQRALESAQLPAPTLAPYRSKKLCTLCNVLIASEVYLLSHLRGKKHQEALRKASGGPDLQHITEAPPGCLDERLERHRERQHALRKKAKKLRVRLTSKGLDYENGLGNVAKVASANSGRIEKCLRDIEKHHCSQGIGQWSNNAITLLERSLLEIHRIFEKKMPMDKSAFHFFNGFSTICKILSLGLDVPQGMSPYLPPKCFVTACMTLTTACQENEANAEYLLCSNKVSVILDLLLCRLKELFPDEEHFTSGWTSDSLPSDPLAASLMRLLALLLSSAKSASVESRARDVVSFTVCVGVVDRLACMCGSVRDPLPGGDPQAAAFLLAALDLLTQLIARCGSVGKSDPTGLGASLRGTELMGCVSMLYGLLLQRAPAPAEAPLDPATASIARATLELLVRVAELDLAMFQSILGAEGISLELRHISAHLLWVCAGQDCLRDLLHLTIRTLGFFVVRNRDNQVVLQSGVQPTVLQQLCQLPFQYFSVPALCGVLFPTLLACCSDNAENRAILEHELSFQLLEDFQRSAAAESDRLMVLLREPQAAGKKKGKAGKLCDKPPLTATDTNSSIPPDAETKSLGDSSETDACLNGSETAPQPIDSAEVAKGVDNADRLQLDESQKMPEQSSGGN